MGTPGFWDDQARATPISTEHARVTRKLDRYERLVREYEDAMELSELDPELEGEVAEQLVPVRAELARLEEDALFTGQYDAGVLRADLLRPGLVVPETRLAHRGLELGAALAQASGVKGNHGPRRAGPRSPRVAPRARRVVLPRRAAWYRG